MKKHYSSKIMEKPLTMRILLCFVALLATVSTTFADNWKGVPFVSEPQQSEWGKYYDDGKGGGAKAPTNITICNVSMTTTNGQMNLYIPFDNTNPTKYARNQIIIPSSTSYGSGTLADLAGTSWSKIVFYIHTAYSNYDIANNLQYRIYLSETNQDHYTLSGTTVADINSAIIPYTDGTLVYEGGIAKSNDGAEVAIAFDNEFDYNGGNVLLTVETSVKSSASGAANRYAIQLGMANYQSIGANYTNATFSSGGANPTALKGIPMMTITYDYSKTQAPTFTPEAGTYNVSQSVAISSGTTGATIHYTTNGSTPTTSSPTYTSPISVTKGTTLKAIAVKSGLGNSDVSTAVYTFRPAKPEFNPTGGIYTSAQTVTITPPTCGHPVTVRYTTDGSVPTASSPIYTSPITISTATTLNAIAFINVEGWENSEMQSAYYNIIEGGALTIDDRLPHTLSYYNNDVMSSPNPIDATITYDGNGGMIGLDAPILALTYKKTLEKDLIDGNYYYTLIPSFTKRPEGKRFEGWKINSITGGSINGYTVGQVIPAETTVTISGTNNMSINFTAQWGEVVNVYYATNIDDFRKALAKTTATNYNLDPNGTVESNFIVANRADFTSALNVSNQIAVTITSVDPITLHDVSDDFANYNFGCSTIECHNNTRFEYITMGGIANIRGNGHHLAFGRGIEKPNNKDYCVNMISAVDTAITSTATVSKVLNSSLRVESGIYNYTYGLISEQTSTNYTQTYSSNGNKVSLVFGSDYDRAMNDNEKLNVLERPCLSQTYLFSGNNNVFHINVKSGHFSINRTEEFYVGFSNGLESKALRKVYIEGGIFDYGIAGGIDHGNAAGAEALMLRMTGGTVYGAIYGAGQYSSAAGKRRMVITGGTIKGWIAGGCNGTQTTGGELNGDTYIYIGGDTEVKDNPIYSSSVGGNVFGAGSGIENGSTVGQVNNSNIVIADNALIERNVYGGGNYGFVKTEGTANIHIFGGTINGNVFGGSNQQQGQTVNINMTGGEIKSNIYGGSNIKGTINNNITMNLGQGKIDGNVYGAGCGTNTDVSGKININITAATIDGSVFGGGEMGKCKATVINMKGGIIGGNIFGGALGEEAVLVNGNKTVNMMGGKVQGCIYGGSRNADDKLISFVNMSGGEVGISVYGGGFFGYITGSTYVNIGKNAIQNSPVSSSNTDKQVIATPGVLNIAESVYAGSDWGKFTTGSTFMEPNITDYSHIYVDALGYSNNNFFIGNSIYGSGTSGDAGKKGHDIYICNYGTWQNSTNSTSRNLYTVQRANNVILYNSNITFIGKGDISSPTTTKQYAMLNIDKNLMVTHNSSLVLSSPIEQLKAIGSYSCTNPYAVDTTVVNYNNLNTCDNKIYFKNGCFVNVNYDNNGTPLYGRLAGFFHAINDNGFSGFAFARPKVHNNPNDEAYAGWSAYAPINVNDGGFVSYNASENTFDVIGGTTGTPVQMPYIHHPQTRGDHEYYRVWSVGSSSGVIQNDVVIVASANGESDDIMTASATMEIPRVSTNEGCSYYRLANIEWSDVAQFVNAGKYNANNYAHLYYNGDDLIMNYQHTAANCTEEIAAIHENPDYTFGLTIIPSEAVTFKDENNNTIPAVLISEEGEEYYTSPGTSLRIYPDANDLQKAKLDFVVTYSNNITSTQAFSPVTITLEEIDCYTGEVLMTLNQNVYIQTTTKIQDVEASVYAWMFGTGTQHDRSSVKVVLPTWAMTVGANYSELSIENITNIAVAPGATRHDSLYFNNNSGTIDDFGMTYNAAKGTDNTVGWISSSYLDYTYDNEVTPVPVMVGRADGRAQIAIDFIVHYNGQAHFNDVEDELAKQIYHVKMTNYEGSTKEFNITIHILRRGKVKNWYISGNGSNSNNGKYPDKPKRSFKALQNANPPYMAGDNIFIVDEVRINTNTEWDGTQYDNNISFYRYPGSHKLSDGTTDGDNPYKGNLFKVNNGQLTANYVTIDGIYGNTDSSINPGGNATITANEQMFYITENGSLVLHNSTLKNNHVVSNLDSVAGCVYMIGDMATDGTVVITNNTLNGNNNNVHIATADQKIAIETGLNDGSHVGVTKTLFPENSHYTPVAYSAEQNNTVAQTSYDHNHFFTDDANEELYYNPVETSETNPYTIYIAKNAIDVYDTVCDSYTWHGKEYTESNVYTYPETGTPTEYLHLVVNHSDSSYLLVETACDSFIWKDSTYTETGLHRFDTLTVNNCDSIMYLNLTIHHSPTLNHTPDTTVVVGSEANLWASGADVLYWTDNNGDILASGDILTVSPTSPTMYYVTGQDYNMETNLVANGDFEQGNVGFYSEYSYSNTASEGKYSIGHNARDHYGSFADWHDHTSGNGLYMIVNGASTPNSKAWYQTVAVQPNTDYAFSAWICNLSPRPAASGNLNDVAQLQFSINNTQMGEIFYVPETAGWTRVYEVWNSGNSNTATITILNQNSNWAGNDFGLDDIAFSAITACTATDSVFVNLVYKTSEERSICDNKLDYDWDGMIFTEGGTKIDTMTAVNGCDSIVTKTLLLNPTYYYPETGITCEGNPYTWEGHNVTLPTSVGTHTVWDSLKTKATDCDSVYMLTLTINSKAEATDEIIACDNYTWRNGVTYYSSISGVTDTVYNATTDGCDSIYTLNLTVNYHAEATDEITACDSYKWRNGMTYTSSVSGETYTVPNATTDGCDSIYTLNLTINYHAEATDEITSCDSYTWRNGVTYYSSISGVTDTVYNATVDGCDSIYTLNLTINHKAEVTDEITSCDSYTWRDGETYDASISGITYTVHNATPDGCDSIYTLNLTINYHAEATDEITACDNYTWRNGVTYYSSISGVTDTVYNATPDGCDSIYTLNLTINYHAEATDEITACDSYKWRNGMTYTTSVSGETYTVPNATTDGCDSIYTLNLTINYHAEATDEITACDSYTWRNGVTYYASTSGVTDTVYNATVDGCDSIYTLNLTINHKAEVTDEITACDSYIWRDGETYDASISGITYTVHNATPDGCDSIYTLNLTINYKAEVTDDITACDNYTWRNGVTYYSSISGVTDTVYNATPDGCDSIYTLNLTVNYHAEATDEITACDSYTWRNGMIYTSSLSGETYTVPNATTDGCDSIYTLNLTINYHAEATDEITACDSYTWRNGVTYYASISGVTDTVHNATIDGCDSIYTLNLTINHKAEVTDEITECDSYTWRDGETYDASISGITYTVHNATPDGCDSIYTLNLTVNYSNLDGEVTETACDSFTWNGEEYDESGDYIFETQTTHGCDSTVILHLTINNSTSSTTEETACDSFTWNGEEYTQSGNYTYHTENVSGCDSTANLILTINHSEYPIFNETACDSSYIWHGVEYTTSGTYQYETVTAQGCERIETLNLIITPKITISGTSYPIGGSETGFHTSTYTLVSTLPEYTPDSVVWNIGCENWYVEPHDNGMYADLHIFTWIPDSIPLTATVYNVCGASTDTLWIHVSYFDVDENDGFNISILPNPNNGNMTISIPEEMTDAQVKVYDLQGNIIDIFRLNETRKRYNMKVYSAGVYYFNIIDDNHNITKKVVIAK